MSFTIKILRYAVRFASCQGHILLDLILIILNLVEEHLSVCVSHEKVIYIILTIDMFSDLVWDN